MILTNSYFIYILCSLISSSPLKYSLEKNSIWQAEINETLIQELLIELWDYDGKFW